MQIIVKVNTNSQKENVEKLDDETYKVKFHAVREKGEANAKLIKILARYFNMAPSNIKIIRGFKTSTKRIVLENFQR